MILVTGAGGNVGRSLLDELATAGLPARAAFRSPDKTARAKGAGKDAVTIDFAAPDTLRPALDGVDAASAPSTRRSPTRDSITRLTVIGYR